MDSKIIMLVEDNEDDIKLTQMAFKKNNIMNEMIILRDGAEALDYLFGKGAYSDRDIGEMPSVILLDIKLPKVDGLEVLKQLRDNKRTKIIPVVILTSSKEEQDLINGYSLGCNSYVQKPVDFTSNYDSESVTDNTFTTPYNATFGVTKVVVQDFECNEEKGNINILPFTLNLIVGGDI